MKKISVKVQKMTNSLGLSVLFAGLFSLSLGGCGSPNNATPATPNATTYSTQQLTGQIDGSSWQFVAGAARMDPHLANHLQIALFNQSLASPCQGTVFSSGGVLLFSLPLQVGETALGAGSPQSSLTFEKANQNWISTNGKIEILSIVNNQIQGQLAAVYDSKTFANGQFSIPLCTTGGL